MIILGTNSVKDTGYDVANSCRFNDDDSAYMHKTPSGAGNRRTFTFSAWIKRANLGAEMGIFTAGADANAGQFFTIMFTDADELNVQFYEGGFQDLKTNRKFRDVSAWYNIIVAVDTTQGTEANRIKIYVNGTQESSFASSDYPTQNWDSAVNNTEIQQIGVRRNGSAALAGYYDGYIAEAVLIDATQQANTDLGEFDEDSNIWKPIDVSGLTFGTNGFYLDFEDSSNLGNDANGGTDFTEVNLAATDQSTDTCTNNFATLNPLLDVNAHPTYSEGNLIFQGTGSTNFAGATIPVSSGKWYVEVKATTVNGSYPIIGVIDSQSTMRRDSTYFVGSDVSATNPSGFAVFSNGDIYHNGDNNFSNLTTTYTSGDIIGMALDMDASPNTLGFYKNGALEVTINLDTAPSGAYMFATAVHSSASSGKGEFNFGSPPFAISSGNTDGNGYGNFEYAVPSGYYSLNTKNLSEYG